MEKPLYRATVTLDIDKDRGTPYDVSDRLVLYSWWDPEYLPTQTRLIQSREVARRVVMKLDLLQNGDFNPGAAGRTEPAKVADAEARLTSAALRIQGAKCAINPVRSGSCLDSGQR